MLSSSYGGFAIADAKSIPVDAIDGLSSRNLQDILIELSLRKPSPIPPGSPDYIANGLNISLNTGLNITSSAGRAVISETLVPAVQQGLLLDARMVAIVYLKADGTLGKKNGEFPAVTPSMVVRYILDGSATIANSAVGVNGNTIAVANNLTKSGTVPAVDGLIGSAAQIDGSVGYYASANSTGFPLTTSEKEMTFIFTCSKITGEQMYASYGTSPTFNTLFGVYSNLARVKLANWSSDFDSTYDLEIGKKYIVKIQNSNNISSVFINGVLVASGAQTISTGSSSLYVGRATHTATGYNSLCTGYYVDIRNKLSTPREIMDEAIATLFPCQYTAYNASYPVLSVTDLASAYHEYKYTETSGTILADTAGTLNGTVTGTTFVNSEIGLNKARKFNGSSDYVTFGSYTLPSEFTMIFCGSPISVHTGTIFSCGSNNWVFNYHQDGSYRFYNGATPYYFLTYLTKRPNFIAYIYKSGIMTVTDGVNSQSQPVTFPSAPTGALYIGKDGSGEYLNGIAEYNNIIPRALDIAEIREKYKSLMKTTQKDIRSILPADTISLARVQTDNDSVIDINQDYAMGRREGAVNGNRKVFLGWKPFSGAMPLAWNDPFGTRKLKTYYVWSSNAQGTDECDVTDYHYWNVAFGVQVQATPNNRIRIVTGINGVTVCYGVWQTSGYLGCYAEVIEDNNIKL